MLAGGASRRMGRDKARVEYEGVPMAGRVADALGRCLERVRLVLRPDAEAPIDLERIDDERPVRAPIVGIHAALRACEVSGVLVAACDLPEIDPRVVLALAASWPAGGAPDIVVPLGPRGPEPLLAIYHPRLVPAIDARIGAGELSLQSLLRDSRTRFLPEDLLRQLDPELRSLRNVNRPDDL